MLACGSALAKLSGSVPSLLLLTAARISICVLSSTSIAAMVARSLSLSSSGELGASQLRLSSFPALVFLRIEFKPTAAATAILLWVN
jgi:hypothetical protein